jgi:hypothetical protein
MPFARLDTQDNGADPDEHFNQTEVRAPEERFAREDDSMGEHGRPSNQPYQRKRSFHSAASSKTILNQPKGIVAFRAPSPPREVPLSDNALLTEHQRMQIQIQEVRRKREAAAAAEATSEEGRGAKPAAPEGAGVEVGAAARCGVQSGGDPRIGSPIGSQLAWILHAQQPAEGETSVRRRCPQCGGAGGIDRGRMSTYLEGKTKCQQCAGSGLVQVRPPPALSSVAKDAINAQRQYHLYSQSEYRSYWRKAHMDHVSSHFFDPYRRGQQSGGAAWRQANSPRSLSRPRCSSQLDAEQPAVNGPVKETFKERRVGHSQDLFKELRALQVGGPRRRRAPQSLVQSPRSPRSPPSSRPTQLSGMSLGDLAHHGSRYAQLMAEREATTHAPPSREVHSAGTPSPPSRKRPSARILTHGRLV